MAKKIASSLKKNQHRLKQQIDNIPNYTKQSRSPPPKRRTDFSHFFSDSVLNRLVGRDDGEEKLCETSLVHCCKSEDKRSRISKYSPLSNVKIESDERTALTACKCDRSQIAKGFEICTNPGNVVWAKMDCQTWWPAEIIEEKSTSEDLACLGRDGYVLVQYYGIDQNAWVDPAKELSDLEDCFEERSCNSGENFQDALKQALSQRKEHISSCQKSESPEESGQLDQQDMSSDKCTSSLSKITGSNLSERSRYKRERKPKVRFAEVTYPPKSTRKDRRLKIMRYLGLIAPVGSPFNK